MEELAHVQMLQVCQINTSPNDSKQIRIASINDPILSRVLGFVTNGWPEQCPSEELKPFHLRSTELTSEDLVILWGLRIVVLLKLCSSVLDLLHDTHIGVVRIKGLARYRVWWPGIEMTLSEPVNNAFNAVSTPRIRRSLHFKCGTFLPSLGSVFI